MTRILLAGALLATAATALAQDIATEIKATEAAPGVYMLEGANGFSSNMGLLVGDEHVVLIDDGMAPITADLVATVDELAGSSIDFIVNTHVHGDHVGSNATLAENGAVIFAHDNIRKRLVEAPDPAGGTAGLPVVTFADAVTFHVNGQEAYVFHIAKAHTDGDAAIHFRGANVIVAGDLHFNHLFPFIDLDSGGSVRGFIAGQRRIIEMADEGTVIIPGHGPVANRDDLQAAVDMLVDAEARVEALVLEGKTEEEVLAANPLADYHEAWNWGFITTEIMTSTLYRSLTAE
ncbi:MAG: MBL fold metallo-hydrolase [Woeseiaceae bacterium]|jgi:glyoxylase-like metal-dependent hydrolase (beta-lactamase superfamily II)|nr:MBL fold metallo-hydrolase [Woeseiaceae bacterium]